MYRYTLSIYILYTYIYIYSIYMLQTWYDLLQTRCATQKQVVFAGQKIEFSYHFWAKDSKPPGHSYWMWASWWWHNYSKIKTMLLKQEVFKNLEAMWRDEDSGEDHTVWSYLMIGLVGCYSPGSGCMFQFQTAGLDVRPQLNFEFPTPGLPVRGQRRIDVLQSQVDATVEVFGI